MILRKSWQTCYLRLFASICLQNKHFQTAKNGKSRSEVGGHFWQFPEDYNLLDLKSEDLNCAALGEKYLDPPDISENQIDYTSSLNQQILIWAINSFTFLRSNQVTKFFSSNDTYFKHFSSVPNEEFTWAKWPDQTLASLFQPSPHRGFWTPQLRHEPEEKCVNIYLERTFQYCWKHTLLCT